METADETTDQVTEQKEKRPRSRAHPLIDLKEAIDKTRVLFEAFDMHWVPISGALGKLGYSSMSGRAGRILSALTQYGLLDERGSNKNRQVRVSKLARHIFGHPKLEDRFAAVQRAALLPTLHQEILERHEDALLDAGQLHWELVDDRKELSRKAADNFISNFFATLEFAKLAEGRILSTTKGDTESNDDQSPESGVADVSAVDPFQTPPAATEMPETPYQESKPFDMPIMLPTGEEVILRMPRKQEPVVFDYMKDTLNTQLELLRPGITGEPPKVKQDDES